MLYADLRKESNTQWDWLEFVFSAVEADYLWQGDILICDNAAIHYAEDIRSYLDEMLAVSGVTLLFLPAYSPEFNPCEYVFAEMKNKIRQHRGLDSFVDEILLLLAQVSREHIYAYYRHCVETILDPKHHLTS